MNSSSEVRELLKRGAPINFTAVARVAGVTSAFLHRHSELSPRIHHLRETQREGTAPPDVNARAAESAVIAALRCKLKEEEATLAHSVQELRRRIRA